jgi:hypothetical protein
MQEITRKMFGKFQGKEWDVIQIMKYFEIFCHRNGIAMDSRKI